jgi:medium-chain acyl-[acyl-carrier-protein] hydrolase
LKRLNGTPAQILEDSDLMRIMMPVLRADFELVGTYAYTPESPLGIPISVFGGLGDDEAGRAELEAWREQTTADFSLRMFAGDHFFIHTARSSILWALWQQLHHLLK